MRRWLEALAAAAALAVAAGVANAVFDAVKHTVDFEEWETEVAA